MKYAIALGLLMLFCAVSQGQTDSLQALPIDTLPPIVPSAQDSLRQGKLLPMRSDTSLSAVVPYWMRDSLKQSPKHLALPEKAWTYVKKDILPELYEEEERLKLKIKIPWREDFVIPYFPRGLLPADPTPPYLPEIAWQRSAILPGLGQIYNQSGWKVPLFWGGYAAIAWWIDYNQAQYQRFGRAYLWSVDDNPSTVDTQLSQRYDSQGLRTARNQFRQNRDNAFLILLGWHGLQILEAYIDAHLSDFDVSEDLSWELRPAFDHRGVGICLTF